MANAQNAPIIDQLTHVSSASASTLTRDHRVGSLDAILIVLSYSGTTTASNISYGGQPLTLLGRITNSTDVAVWYLNSPSVGVLPIVANYGTTGTIGFVAYTILAAAKNSTPKIFTASYAGGPVTLPIVANGNSLILDIISGTGNVGSPLSGQRAFTNSSPATDGSFSYANGPQNILWANASFNGSHIAVAISPAQAPSAWFPSIDLRNSTDVIQKNALDTANLPQDSFGNFPYVFYQNSFLHTIGRIIGGNQQKFGDSDKGAFAITSLYSMTSIINSPFVGDFALTGETQANIKFDSSSNSGVKTTETTYSWSHTCAGDNGLLVVGVASRPSPITVASITYGGVNLTKIREDTNGNRIADLWYLIGPMPGANNVVVTLSGATPTHSSAFASSYTGVDQTNPLDSQNGFNSAATTTPLVTVPTTLQNYLIVDLLNTGLDDGVATPGVDQTAVGLLISVGSCTATSNYKIASPSRTSTMSYTVTSSNAALSAATFKPAPASFMARSLTTALARFLNPTQSLSSNSAGIIFTTSQILIDKISQIAVASGSTTSVDHYVSSQDAVLLVFASQMGIAQGINAVTLNGSALTNLSPNSVSTLAGGIFYSVNPNVGINTITANITLAAAMQLIVISLLGVDKKTLTPIATSGNGLASSPSLSIVPSSANSLILDFVGTLAGSGSPDTSQVQYFEQPQTGSAAFGSIKLASASPQTMAWATAGAAWAQFAIALEPSNYASLWYPNIDNRNLLDVIKPGNMDTSINPSGNFYQANGYYASNLWENSFLHTVGRMTPFGSAFRISLLASLGIG